MILKSIKLNNFGIYQGTNDYRFDTHNDRNMILISGRNGSGKTTLLTAIKLSIYGPYLLGYQTCNEKYLSYVQEKLSSFAQANCAKDYSIEIQFDYVELGHWHTYSIKRSWDVQNAKIVENVFVKKDDQLLTPYDQEVLFSRIYQELPPSVFDFFFFDGEKIDQLFNFRKSSAELFNFFDVLFNVELFQNLKYDLRKYIKQKNIYSQLSTQEKEFAEHKDHFDTLEDDLTNLEEDLQDLESKKNDFERSIQELEAQFRQMGGVQEKELQQLSERLVDLTQIKEELLAKNRSTIHEYLPFIMLKPMLKNLVLELEAEQKSSSTELLMNLIKEPSLTDKLKQKSGFSKSHVQRHLSCLVEILAEDHKEGIHGLGSKEIMEIFQLADQIESMDSQTIKEEFSKIANYNEEILFITKQMQMQYSDDINEVLAQKEKLYEELGLVKHRIESLQEKLVDKKSQHNEMQQLLEKMQLQILSSKKDENIFVLVEKINRVIDRYVREIRKEKTHLLEEHVTDMFQKLIRKDDFIQKIRIDHDTGEMQFFNILGFPMSENSLSAGERQIFILSLLWGILKVSQRQVPLVFDSLLARLDTSHKKAILTELLPSIGQQVLLLATDTEVTETDYYYLENFINHNYQIDYDSPSRSVIINHQQESEESRKCVSI